MSGLKTYILHVKGETERKRHILDQVAGHDLDVEFVLDGDIPDLDEQIVDTYFDGALSQCTALTSCTYKHIIAQQRIVDSVKDIALVLEDDMVFYSNWDSVLPRILEEIRRRDLSGFIVSLEDSSLKYPNGSERRPGQLLYQKIAGRNAGAYLIDYNCAWTTLQFLKIWKTDRGPGLYHNFIAQQGAISMYWAHPPVAVQGTAIGKFATTVSKNKVGFAGRASWMVQKYYKRLLYRLR